MITEISVMKLSLDTSTDELRELNTALNCCVISGDANVIKSLHTVLTVMQRGIDDNVKLLDVVYNSSDAMKRENLFSPKMMYQLKEDFETVSLLHSRHKKETERLIEQGNIATQRNAKLRLENEDLKDRLLAIEKAVK